MTRASCVALIVCGLASQAAGDDWSRLADAVDRLRALDGGSDAVLATLESLERSRESDVRSLAAFHRARVTARRGDANRARAAWRGAAALREVHAAAWRLAEAEHRIVIGDAKAAYRDLVAMAKSDFRPGARDALLATAAEQALAPKAAAAVLDRLAAKSTLAVPADELLYRAAVLLEAPGGSANEARTRFRRLLLLHPESAYATLALSRVPLESLSTAERKARMDLLFKRRAYEPCRTEAVTLLTAGKFVHEAAFFLGKIGSERLRDDYAGAAKYLAVAAAAPDATLARSALHSLAIVLGKLGRTAESVGAFDQWLSRHGSTAEAKELAEVHYDRGRALRLGGRPAEAAKSLAAFLATARGSFDRPRFLWFVAFWRFLAGDFAAALRDLGPMRSHGNSLVGGKARYWSGRAQWALGKKDDALTTWATLAREQPLTWYGALAEQRLRDHGALERVPAAVSVPAPPKPRDPFRRLPASPALRRLRLAALLGDPDALRDVLREVRPALSKALGHARLETLEAGLRDRLEQEHEPRREARRKLGARLGPRPTPHTVAAWRAIYPRAYRTHVLAAATSFGVPEAMVYAHMLQESRYDPRMISGAPAFGLLELLDRTARRLAKELGDNYGLWKLMVPAWNVRWGTAYLGGLVKRYRGQLVFAMAAYNGGPALLDTELTRSATPAASRPPLDVLIDDIGPHETRNYVRRVAEHLLRTLAAWESPERAAEVRRALFPTRWEPHDPALGPSY